MDYRNSTIYLASELGEEGQRTGLGQEIREVTRGIL
jgi:hypothetical protein